MSIGFNDEEMSAAFQAMQTRNLTDEIARLRAALNIYADSSNWDRVRTSAGHGDTFPVLTWKGPREDADYMGPKFGPEYAQRALDGPASTQVEA